MTDVYDGLRNNHLGAPGGYFGNALVVDVTDGSTTTLALPERVLRDYLGGAGLGVWLMTELAPPGVDPLDPAAPLAFVFSPLVGTPLTTSAKFAVVAKSPLTGLLTDALASSHFAISGKFTGHDAIVLTGRAQAPAHLLIDADGVRLRRRGAAVGHVGVGRRGVTARAARPALACGLHRPGGQAACATPRSLTTAGTPGEAVWAR